MICNLSLSGLLCVSIGFRNVYQGCSCSATAFFHYYPCLYIHILATVTNLKALVYKYMTLSGSIDYPEAATLNPNSQQNGCTTVLLLKWKAPGSGPPSMLRSRLSRDIKNLNRMGIHRWRRYRGGSRTSFHLAPPTGSGS